MNKHTLITSTLLIVAVLVIAGGLIAWKAESLEASHEAASQQGEPMESVTAAIARPHQAQHKTTAIGTVLATRSVTLRNEHEGTVERVSLVPGRIVEAGTVLVQLDVSVEQAELSALRAEAALAQTVLERYRQALGDHAVSALEVDRAGAQLDVARAQIARVEAIIARKTIRAPFPARVGLSDVHPGQFLDSGTVLTTLQGLDEAVHVDFSVTQSVAAGLKPGDQVQVHAEGGARPLAGTLVALDARIDPVTRTALSRARVETAGNLAGVPAPGSSVRVEIPVGEPSPSVLVPASALRRGPEGDHVFVIAQDAEGHTRAHRRFVDTAASLGNQVVIRDGLAAGEQVAASGSFKLREAALVAVQGEPAAGPDAGTAGN